jgi:hydroxymethylpyrimidine pyrophosphatase-like HAD family hydrolase
MAELKLLLCTDMDRTVIPNGLAVEHAGARARFKQFCALPEVKLVYVSGRHKALVQDAIETYSLPHPDYAITDVGTEIYRLQEQEKQNTYKLSYYVPDVADKDKIIELIQMRFAENGIQVNLIWSVDDLESIGLIDVLPRSANKLHAVEFLYQRLGFGLDEVIFAGDSGNDLPMLASPIPFVLVANATDEVKQAAKSLVNQYGHSESFYLAQDNDLGMNGNYSAGILAGIWHFSASSQKALRKIMNL